MKTASIEAPINKKVNPAKLVNKYSNNDIINRFWLNNSFTVNLHGNSNQILFIICLTSYL